MNRGKLETSGNEEEKAALGAEAKKVPPKKQEKELLCGTTRGKASMSQMPASAAPPIFTIPLIPANQPPASANSDQEQMAMDTEDVEKEMQKVKKKQSNIVSFFTK